jgi:tRNA dimethylallyltransferase
MSADPFANVLILTGPTGSGKTALALTLAERVGAELVAMDSMTLYRGLDIGTAKPTAAERRQVPHHLIDVLEPWESASVAWWLERAADCCRDIESRGKRALFVGGTCLYLKALLHGLFDGPREDPEVRSRLTAFAKEHGTPVLHGRLAEVDPETARRLHPNDLRRIVRALEVWEQTGRPISSWQQEWKHPAGLPQHRCLCLDVPRAELYRRIDARVLEMFATGLVDEARALKSLPQPLSRQAAQAVGYQEVFAHLDGQATLAETIDRIQTRSRNFAKRQLTWFRHIPECSPASAELTFALWAS